MELFSIISISILIVLVSILILIIIFKFKNNKNNNENQNEKLIVEKQEAINENLLVIKEFINQNQNKQTNDLINFKDSINSNFNQINEKINNKIQEGFLKNENTSKELMENIGRLTEKSEQLKQYNITIEKLIQVLNNNKLRGNLGEYQLESILINIFGQNLSLYKRQYKLSNNTICDVLIHAPNPIGDICIDAKFPLSNFKNLLDNQDDTLKEKEYKKLFIQDVKKHITDISSKYIIQNETSEYAIMFIPAEYIYIYINNFCQDLIDFALTKKVWLTGPTNLISTLTMIHTILKNIETNKFAKEIKKDLMRLSEEFERFVKRNDKLFQTASALTNSMKEFKTTSDKIIKRFNDIKELNFEDINDKENN